MRAVCTLEPACTFSLICCGWLGMVCLIVLLAPGCGKSPPPYPAARLEGSVTIDGEPVAEGRIQFVPMESGPGGATSAEIVDGRYLAEYVPLGRMNVMFTATRETGKMITEYSTPYPEVVNIIPQKYRSGIELEVTGDNPKQDFELSSRQKQGRRGRARVNQPSRG